MIYRQNFTFYQKKTGLAAFLGVLQGALAGVFCLILFSQTPLMAAESLAFKAAHETRFPDEILPTNQGSGFSVQDHEGALLINFWATWCAPCVHELPDLAHAARAFADRGQAIDVVLISVDRKGQDHAQSALDERGITDVISAYNPSSSWPRALGIKGLPSTYLVSADRQNIYLLHGPAKWDDTAVMDEVASLILP